VAFLSKSDVQNATPPISVSSYILHRSQRRVRLWSILHTSAERIASYSGEAFAAVRCLVGQIDPIACRRCLAGRRIPSQVAGNSQEA
jgi:hypothetical protein